MHWLIPVSIQASFLPIHSGVLDTFLFSRRGIKVITGRYMLYPLAIIDTPGTNKNTRNLDLQLYLQNETAMIERGVMENSKYELPQAFVCRYLQ